MLLVVGNAPVEGHRSIMICASLAVLGEFCVEKGVDLEKWGEGEYD